MNPKVAIIVLNWNGYLDTLECLASLQKVTYPNLEIVMVDNGSTDESVAVIRKLFPTLITVETGRNLGYAGGNNVGLRTALANDAEFVMLLNNDTVVSPDVIDAFLAVANSCPAGALLAAKIYNYYQPNVIWYAGSVWRPEIPGFVHLDEGRMDATPNASTSQETDYACGCAVFTSAKVIRSIGFLDETYFLYWEDVEWSFRARQNGYKCLFVPQAKVWHKISQSSDRKDSLVSCYYNVRNGLKWASKFLSHLENRRFRIRTIRTLLPDLKVCEFRDNGFSRTAYWTIRENLRSYREQWEDGRLTARLLGLRDYLLSRHGYQDQTIRKLRKVEASRKAILHS